MKEEIQTLWVEELRSGRRKQGNGALRNGDRFCCLGVLCELAVDAGVIPASTKKEGEGGEIYAYGDQGATGVLPSEVVEWAGLKRCDPRFMVDGRDVRLSVMNDIHKATFNQIAEYIERDEEVG